MNTFKDQVEKLKRQYSAGILTMESFISQETELYLAEGKLDDIYQKYYSKIPFDTFMQIIAADPTTPVRGNEVQKPGKFSKWLLDIFMKGNLKLEDLYKATEYLGVFMRHQKKLEISQRNINQYTSLADLFAVIQPYREVKTQSQLSASAKKDAEKVFENQEWLVVVPKTEAASCYYGKGTEWCTAADVSDNRFEYYNQYGPLYINIHKQTQRKYQFHFPNSEFMDENGDTIDLIEFLASNKELENFYWEKEIKNQPPPSDFTLNSDGTGVLKTYQYDEFIDEMGGDGDLDFYKDITKGEGFSYFDSMNYQFDKYRSDEVNDDNLSSIKKILTNDIKNGEYEWDSQLDWNNTEDVVNFALDNNDDIRTAFDNAYTNVYSNTAESEAYESITSQIMQHFGLNDATYEVSSQQRNAYKNDGTPYKVEKTIYNWKLNEKQSKAIMIYTMDGDTDAYQALAKYANGGEENEKGISSPYYGWQGDWEREMFNDFLSDALYEYLPQEEQTATQ